MGKVVMDGMNECMMGIMGGIIKGYMLEKRFSFHLM
jgi:hypothetical protein